MHAATETGMDNAYALRTANKQYRTTPLRALWQHAPYFHDGSASTLADVVSHYDRARKLGLTAAQQHDLIEYLKSLKRICVYGLAEPRSARLLAFRRPN